MNEDKKKTQKRKAEQKMKLIMKKAGFNLEKLRHEINIYQLRFRDQHTLREPHWISWKQTSDDMKNKNQHYGLMEVRE